MSEADEQKAIVAWYRETYPQFAMSLRVSQFGNDRGRSSKLAAIRTAKAKGQGAVVGEADFAILVPRGTFGCLVLEHKAEGSSHKLTLKQIEYLGYHESIGNCAASTRGVEAAKAVIKGYMDG